MSFTGFTKTDFAVFHIDGLEERMESLIANIRPKLEALGNHFAPMLSVETGEEMFAHVAKHARRTKNPPNDTWVAFASNSRGYKMMPHFQIGLWESHVFIWFAIIYEAQNKSNFGHVLESKADAIYEAIPDHFVWSADHMKPEATLHGDLSKDELKEMFIRLQNVKKAEILCGLNIAKEQAIQMSPDEFLNMAESVFKTVMPLYKLAVYESAEK